MASDLGLAKKIQEHVKILVHEQVFLPFFKGLYDIKHACRITTTSMLQFDNMTMCLAGKYSVLERLKFRKDVE